MFPPGEGTHSMKVTTYAPPFRPHFFRPLENLYSFDPYIWAKMRKMSYFDSYFWSKLGEMYSFFPHEVRPMFPSPCVPQSLCFPVPMFPKDVSQSLFSPIPLFPSPDVPLKYFHSLCSPNIFPSPYVPQSLCSAVPLFPQSIVCSQTPSSPELFPVPIFPKYVPQSLCYT